MNNSSIILAYCIENVKYANMIKGVLSDNIEVENFQIDDIRNMTALADRAKGNFNPILILISDNFLKSDIYMDNAFETIQTLSNKGNLIPIIVEGEYKVEGRTEIIPTSFEKVSNVIQYMNFWQDKYLQLRKTKVNEDDPNEGNEFVNKLHSYRQISGEIGELLRFLRSIPTWTYDQFVESNYGGIVKAKHLDAKIETTADDEFDQDLLADLGDIPGLEMLKETEDGRIILPPFDQKAADELIHSGIDTPTSIENMIADASEENTNPHQKRYMDLDDFINDTPIEEDKSDKKSTMLEDLDKKIFSPKSETKAEKASEEEAQLKSQLSKILNDSDDHISKFEYEKEATENKIIEKEEEIQKPIIETSKADSVENTITEYKNKLELNPQQSEMRLAYAQFLAKNGRLSDSTKELETILLYNPSDEDAYFQLALLAEQNRDYLMSKNFYEKVALLNPDFPNIHYHLGILTSEFFVGQKKQAAKYFKLAYKSDVKNVDAHYQYAKLLLSYSGKYEKVIDHMQQVLDQQPNHPFAHFDMAKAHYESGNLKEAVINYNKAISINSLLKTEENDELFKVDAELLLQLENSKIKEETKIDITEQDNNDKIVLITGATSGIGKAITYLLASHGFKLILTGRRVEKLNEIKTDLQAKYKNKIQLLPFDVRDRIAVENMIHNLPEEWRNIDILINNAGLALGFDEIHEGNITEWDTMIDTNIKGLLYMTRAVAPYMVKRRKGHILNICSTAGKDVYPKGNVYAATKHAVDALTKAMRLDLYKYDIKVSQVAPGHVEETEFALVRFAGDAEKSKIYNDFNPLKSSDVADAIYFILSRPAHVNVQDILLMGTQQGNVTNINRDGRRFE
jgi:NADP-dependent 3-hydroxy acid dehydrogenase YdfG/Tfp pilus assembly protein PilF